MTTDKYISELSAYSGARKEIDRYKWIESEMAGYDIGMERAAREWVSRYAVAWIKHHSAKR